MAMSAVRLVRRWLLTVTLVTCVAACGGAEIRGPRAGLRVIVEPILASVYVDDHFVGTGRVLAARPANLRTGPHQVTITSAGYFPHDVEVDLTEGVTTIDIRLRRIPP